MVALLLEIQGRDELTKGDMEFQRQENRGYWTKGDMELWRQEIEVNCLKMIYGALDKG